MSSRLFSLVTVASVTAVFSLTPPVSANALLSDFSSKDLTKKHQVLITKKDLSNNGQLVVSNDELDTLQNKGRIRNRIRRGRARRQARRGRRRGRRNITSEPYEYYSPVRSRSNCP